MILVEPATPGAATVQVRSPPLYAPAAQPRPPWANRALAWAPIAVALLLLIVRLLGSASLGEDEAEQVFYAQQLEWGYSQQPPLFTWLSWAALQIFGVDRFALAAVRVAIYAALLGLVAAGLRQLGVERRNAMLGSLMLAVAPLLGWKLVFAYMHTLLALTLFAALVWVVLRLMKAPTLGWYALLGVVLGLGMLAKYNFAVFAGALALAALTHADTRRFLLSWKMLVAVLAAVALLGPHACWLLEHHARVQEQLLERVAVRPALFEIALGGALLDWGRHLLALGGPLLVALWFVRPQFRGLTWQRDAECFNRRLTPLGSPLPGDVALLQRTGLAVLALTFGLVVAGLGWFRLHWLAPAAPLLVWIAWGRWQATGAAVRWVRCAVVAGLALLGQLGWRLAAQADGADAYRDDFFARVKHVIVERGWSQRRLVTNNLVLAGNLRLAFPATPIDCLECPAFRAAATAEEQEALRVFNRAPARDNHHGPERLCSFDMPTPHRDRMYRRAIFMQP